MTTNLSNYTDMYALHFIDTPLYACFLNNNVQLVNKGSATIFDNKQAANAALKNAGEFFEVVDLKRKSRGKTKTKAPAHQGKERRARA